MGGSVSCPLGRGWERLTFGDLVCRPELWSKLASPGAASAGAGRGPTALARRAFCRRAVSTACSLLPHPGRWRTPFDPVFTEVDTFHPNKYKAVKVPMMFRAGNFASTFDKNLRCHVLKLPYRGNATMLVVLMEKMGDHLALEDYLTSDLVDSWLRNMRTR